MGELNPELRSTGRLPEHYAWRSIQHAICAVFAYRQVETPEKRDGRDAILAKLVQADPLAAEVIASSLPQVPPTITHARAVLRAVLSYLSRDSQLHATVQTITRQISGPLYRLALVPPLKP
jgi:hypothetical protein